MTITSNWQWIARWIAGVLTACALWPSVVQAQSDILIDFDAANPPFMFGTVTRAEGFYPDLIEAIFRQMNRPARLTAKPWKRAIAELDLGTAGVGGIYKTEERLKKYAFSEPLFVERIVVYFHRDKAIHFRTLADLNGKRVGVLLGWSYGDDFDNARKAGRIAVEEVYADSQNFDKLAQGRVDAVLAIEQVGTHLMRAARNANIEKSPVFLAANPTHLVFNKNQHAEALLRDFNAALAELKKNGVYTTIVDKIGAVDK